jgi:hypothetical protein
LLLLRAVVDQRAAIYMDLLSEDIDFSQRRSVVQIPDDLPAEQPRVIYVLANSLAGKAGGSQMPDEGPEASHQFLDHTASLFPTPSRRVANSLNRSSSL